MMDLSLFGLTNDKIKIIYHYLLDIVLDLWLK